MDVYNVGVVDNNICNRVQHMLMGIIGIPETNNIKIIDSNEVNDSTNKSYFGITL